MHGVHQMHVVRNIRSQVAPKPQTATPDASREAECREASLVATEQVSLSPDLDLASSGSEVAVDMTPDGKHWIAAGDRGIVVDGKFLAGLDVATSTSGVDVSISDDGKHWIAAGDRGIVVNGQFIRELDIAGVGNRVAVDLTADGEHWIAAGDRGVVVNGQLVEGLGMTIGGNRGAAVDMSPNEYRPIHWYSSWDA